MDLPYRYFCCSVWTVTVSILFFLVWQDGNTPLMCASQGGHVEIVEVLLQHHADVNIQNSTNVCHLLYTIFNQAIVPTVHVYW